MPIEQSKITYIPTSQLPKFRFKEFDDAWLKFEEGKISLVELNNAGRKVFNLPPRNK
ncbi:MAG: hypothetical protein AAB656_00960 [Patescibacteria group bacterium]